MKKDEKGRQRKFITGYIYIYIYTYFQCYVNVVVYDNNGEGSLRAIPPQPGSSIYGFPRLDSRPRGIIILIGTTQISIVHPRLSNVDTACKSMFALNVFETARRMAHNEIQILLCITATDFPLFLLPSLCIFDIFNLIEIPFEFLLRRGRIAIFHFRFYLFISFFEYRIYIGKYYFHGL